MLELCNQVTTQIFWKRKLWILILSKRGLLTCTKVSSFFKTKILKATLFLNFDSGQIQPNNNYFTFQRSEQCRSGWGCNTTSGGARWDGSAQGGVHYVTSSVWTSWCWQPCHGDGTYQVSTNPKSPSKLDDWPIQNWMLDTVIEVDLDFVLTSWVIVKFVLFFGFDLVVVSIFLRLVQTKWVVGII